MAPRSSASGVTLVMALSVASSACVGWHGGTANSPATPPPHATEWTTQNVAVSIAFSDLDRQRGQSGALEPPRGDEASMLSDETPRTMLTHELQLSLDSVGLKEIPAASRNDLTLDLRVATLPESDSGLVYGSLAFFTGTVFPLWWSNAYTIHAILRDAKGAEIAERTIYEHVTKVAELFFVFGMPFAPPWSADRDLWRSVARDLAEWTSAARTRT